MSTTYTWEITGLKKVDSTNGLQNAILEVMWKKIGTDTDTGIQGEFEGRTKFSPSQIDPSNFVPFNQLTAEQVIDWIKQIVTGGYEITVNERIQQDIDSKKHTVVELSTGNFPWQA
jgi:hypothetical protein